MIPDPGNDTEGVAEVRLSRRPEKIDIEPYSDDLAKYLESQGDILAAYLYGSYGTALQTRFSDVDIALLFYTNKRPDLQRVLTLEAAMNAICHEDDINVVVLNNADPLLQFRVVETGRPIFEREREAVSDFRERVFKTYFDFEPFYRALCADYDKAIQEAYLRDRPKPDS